MPNTSSENTPPGGEVPPPVTCPFCHAANSDWIPYCIYCGRELPEQEKAIRAEIGHIGYLLDQVEELKQRNVLSAGIYGRIHREYAQRRAQLRNSLEARKSAPVPPPIVPPIPARFVTPSLPAAVPSTPTPVSSRPLLQEHGLKIMFALAVALLLIGLRGILAWDSQIAVRLLPLLPFAITVMFWMFGKKTRGENPWAGYVYDSLAALMLGIDLIAANRYWLNPMGSALDTRTALFLAATASTLSVGAMLFRYRAIAYLHLCLGGALITLFFGLQVVRHMIFGQNDFRTTPLPLFAAVYLLAAAVCLGFALPGKAGKEGKREGGKEGDEERTNEPRTTSHEPRATTSAVWTLWMHLAVTAVLLFAASELVRAEPHNLEPFALLALLTGGLYACAAQALDDARNVYLSILFLFGGGALHLVEAKQVSGGYFGWMLLGSSALALAFTVYNGRRTQQGPAASALPKTWEPSAFPDPRTPNPEPRSELAKAWGRVCLTGVSLATALVWIGFFYRLVPGVGVASVREYSREALLALGCASFFLFFMSRENRAAYVYGVLSSAGIALVYAIGIGGYHLGLELGDGLASVALIFALLGAYLQISRNRHAAPDAHIGDRGSGIEDRKQGLQTNPEPRIPNPDPVVHVAVAVAYAAVIDWMVLWLGNQPSVHAEWVLLPGIAALLVVLGGRQSADADRLRLYAYGALYTTLLPEVMALTGGTHGVSQWTADQRQNCGLALLALAWFGGSVGFRLSRNATTERWEGISTGALVTGLLSGLTATSAVVLRSHVSEPTALIGMGVVAGVCALSFLDAALQTRQTALSLALFTLALGAGISLVAYTANPLAIALVWSLLTLASAATLLWLGRRLESAVPARMGVCVLFGGYTLLEVLCNGQALSPQNGLLVDWLWIGAGALFTVALLRAATWNREETFGYAAGLTAVGTYLRLVHLLFHPASVWVALGLLPMLVLLFGVGERLAGIDTMFSGRPLRRTAILISFCALVGSVGNQLLSSPQGHPLLGTLTLAAYGCVYALLACYRRTSQTVTLAALTLTAAYLHSLQVGSALWGHTPSMPIPHLCFLAIQAGVFWSALGWGLRRQSTTAPLARPLQALAAAIAFCSASVAVLTVQTPGAGLWSILTLAWSGGIWFALWRMEVGETCLHIGTWNLLVAWGLVLYNQFGADPGMLDLYLLPVGLYLMAIGHRVSGGQQKENAQLYWWVGLLLTMTPSFLDHWRHVAGWHTVLFLSECAVFVLWGIGQRIRAFVSVGFGYLLLFAATVATGHPPDVGGTLAALLGGIALFIAGFYALTHKDAIQRGLTRLDAQWQAWQSWR